MSVLVSCVGENGKINGNAAPAPGGFFHSSGTGVKSGKQKYPIKYMVGGLELQEYEDRIEVLFKGVIPYGGKALIIMYKANDVTINWDTADSVDMKPLPFFRLVAGLDRGVGVAHVWEDKDTKTKYMDFYFWYAGVVFTTQVKIKEGE